MRGADRSPPDVKQNVALCRQGSTNRTLP
jgi:hypothetical protein